MRKSSRLIIVALIALTYAFPAFCLGGGEEANFQTLSQKLENAIEERNFHEAREAIEELMPLMKEELKKDKKTLSELKREESPEMDPTEFEKKLVRKTELYDALKELVNISPAALRVKSERIKTDVKEFIDLS
ncbi:hypothetical protein [Marinoscillum sp. 108]|jgi:alkylhydroperoxidase/carboxymuconolactone decarboxylase family protein YurZ|uniref:DUF4168 domain-containing protein n=1 Tax=Marinoscillum luteum TaxID=861051 RepID=A0ABW7N607_9BACT|nr:hypothetical protein [Marinoscillum sp. 108]VXD12846.1 conserved hypothetical protein [Marinoscillum sp. 108]